MKISWSKDEPSETEESEVDGVRFKRVAKEKEVDSDFFQNLDKAFR